MEKVNKHIAALNTYNADTTNTRALAEAAEFFKRIEFHGKRLTVETLAFMFEHLDSSVTLEHVAMTTDTAIIVWREHFLMGDGTVGLVYGGAYGRDPGTVFVTAIQRHCLAALSFPTGHAPFFINTASIAFLYHIHAPLMAVFSR